MLVLGKVFIGSKDGLLGRVLLLSPWNKLEELFVEFAKLLLYLIKLTFPEDDKKI